MGLCLEDIGLENKGIFLIMERNMHLKKEKEKETMLF
jgi:hypothetical protein